VFDGCKDLEKLEIENCLKLRKIQGYGCKLDELILNKFPDLIHVHVPFNRLRKLEIKDYEEIEALFCNNNNLKELDISELTNLKKMHCYRNMLETLDCRELRSLRELFAQENYCLKEVKLKLHPWLEQIDLAENVLISLDISRCKALILRLFFLFLTSLAWRCEIFSPTIFRLPHHIPLITAPSLRWSLAMGLV
jgi:hypothetical protein